MEMLWKNNTQAAKILISSHFTRAFFDDGGLDTGKRHTETLSHGDSNYLPHAIACDEIQYGVDVNVGI